MRLVFLVVLLALGCGARVDDGGSTPCADPAPDAVDRDAGGDAGAGGATPCKSGSAGPCASVACEADGAHVSYSPAGTPCDGGTCNGEGACK